MNSGTPFDDVGRKNPAAGVHVQLSGRSWVLLTVTTAKRRPWLACTDAHRLLHHTWQDTTAWLVSDYILMPDHLHCFCAPSNLGVSIERWITYWKREFRRRHDNADWKFQSRGWHHRLRQDESYSSKWIYVEENPVRKGLVQNINDWTYKGRVHDIRWT